VATLTPADLTRLKTLAGNSGWKVILGVTLKHPGAARAADEAKFAQQILGGSLYGIEIGNEPNYYPNHSTAKFWSDFQAYKAAILKAAPGVGLVGPSPGRVPAADAWLKDFAAREAGHVDIAAFSGHYYPACAKNTPAPTVTSLLSTAYRATEKTRADLVAGLAKSLGVPGILDEGNSVSCEGMDGVSDVFASACGAWTPSCSTRRPASRILPAQRGRPVRRGQAAVQGVHAVLRGHRRRRGGRTAAGAAGVLLLVAAPAARYRDVHLGDQQRPDPAAGLPAAQRYPAQAGAGERDRRPAEHDCPTGTVVPLRHHGRADRPVFDQQDRDHVRRSLRRPGRHLRRGQYGPAGRHRQQPDPGPCPPPARPSSR